MRRVHGAKPIEDGAQPTLRVRPGKGEAQWKKQKTKRRDQNSGHNSAREDLQFAIGAEEKRRRDKEEIDRHVRQDHQRHERNGVLPRKVECSNVTTPRRDPITAAVDDEKEDRQTGASGERFDSRNGHFVQAAARRAIETVNMPQRSTSMDIFWNPATRTSSSISAVVRRRMTQGCPSRLRKTRAMNSICGCHG